MSASVVVLPDGEAVARAALRQLVALCHEAVRQRGVATLALSGGSTPRRLYGLMAMEALPFDRMHFFFGDERHVPPDHPDSNFHMASEALFSPAGIPSSQLHRMEGERAEVSQAASAYETELRRFFQPPGGAPPRMDVILLGLGADGHTASLFPGTPGLREQRAWVVGQRVEQLHTERISLTPPVLNAGRAVMFLVQGADKASAVQAALEGSGTVDELPARVVQPSPGGLWWYLDRASAQRLKPSTVTSHGAH